MKSKTIAYLLWLSGIFGILGFHRFYLGKIGTGFIWMFTGGLLGIGAIYDFKTLIHQVDVKNLQSEVNKLKNKNNMISL